MTQEGKLLICDRCGKTSFVKKDGMQFDVIDGYAEESPTYAEYDPNWGYISCYPREPDVVHFKGLEGMKTDFASKLLCPSCRDEFANLMFNFWGLQET